MRALVDIVINIYWIWFS